MQPVPFTERSNEITQHIDAVSCEEMVGLLGKTDAEIFSGVTKENLFSSTVIESIAALANAVRVLIQSTSKDVAIVLGGCGTSGRLGYLISKVCNELAQSIGFGTPFFYSIAGGDKSLLTSQEAPEDDPNEGLLSLRKICANKKRVVYVGITCGISAPFVGGQLDWCIKNLNTFTPILLGFNQIEMARNIKITGWDKTMLDVAQEMNSLSKQRKAIVINPILGAEAITGSSRMKGGSATKVILETAFLSALNSLEAKDSSLVSTTTIISVLNAYQDICRDFYAAPQTQALMSNFIQLGGDALKENGAIHYIASGWKGVIPLIDSTECPPTFGSTVDDVRGFIRGGYNFLDIDDYGKENASFKLGISDAVDFYRTHGKKNVQVFVFLRAGESDPLVEELQTELGPALLNMRGNGRVVAVIMKGDNDEVSEFDWLVPYFDKIVHLPYPEIGSSRFQDWGLESASAMRESLEGMCLKWLVNAVSTCSHVLLGKVYKNYMCDVKVSNNKLYHRAIGIIQKLTYADYERAEEALLTSIYGSTGVDDELKTSPVARHYERASSMDKVVPLAIILAKLDCSIEEARCTLARYPVLKSALSAITDRR